MELHQDDKHCIALVGIMSIRWIVLRVQFGGQWEGLPSTSCVPRKLTHSASRKVIAAVINITIAILLFVIIARSSS